MTRIFADFAAADGLALAVFAAAFLGYGPLLRRFGTNTVNACLRPARHLWMARVLERDNRTMDSMMVGHIINSVTFFASTNAFLIAAILGMIGAVERVRDTVARLAFVAPGGSALLEIKLLLLVLVLIVGFFHLTHAARQGNYTIALLGGLPIVPPAEPARAAALTEPVAEVMDNAIASFNAGIRGYYFAFAALAWLIGPYAMIAATVVVLAVLLHRQTLSATARALRRYAAATR